MNALSLEDLVETLTVDAAESFPTEVPSLVGAFFETVNGPFSILDPEAADDYDAAEDMLYEFVPGRELVSWGDDCDCGYGSVEAGTFCGLPALVINFGGCSASSALSLMIAPTYFG